MDIVLFLVGISVVILLGFLSEALFTKTHIPDALLLFLIGILIGPVLGYITPDYFSNIESLFVTLTLILILFEAGLNIHFWDLLKGAVGGSMLSVLFFLSSMLVTVSVMVFLGYPLVLSFLAGAILGGTSSVVVIPMVKLLKLGSESSLILTLESTLTDVLCIVISMTIIEAIALSSVDLIGVAFTLLSTFLVAIFIGIVAGAFWFLVKSRVPQVDNAYMTTVAFIILIYAFAEAFRSNGAIAVLSLGAALGNSRSILFFLGKETECRIYPAEKQFYAELTFFVKVFFFVYLGIIMDFSDWHLLLYGAAIALLIALVRPSLVHLVARYVKGITLRDKIGMGIMMPKGLAAAVLAQIVLTSPEVLSIPGAADIAVIVLSVILFSIVFTSLLVFSAGRLGMRPDLPQEGAPRPAESQPTSQGI